MHHVHSWHSLEWTLAPTEFPESARAEVRLTQSSRYSLLDFELLCEILGGLPRNCQIFPLSWTFFFFYFIQANVLLSVHLLSCLKLI